MAAKLKYGWDTLNVGESLTIENETVAKISPSATTYGKRNGKKYRCKTDGVNVIVTRTE